MAVVRVEKNQNYTTMCNHHLRDKNLSLKAKGLLSFCLSLPECWDYSINGLAAVCKEGRDCIMSTLSELEASGYLIRDRTRNEDGTLGSIEYVIFEQPQIPESAQPKSDNPTLDKPTLEKPVLEETTQIRTNSINTKRNNNEEKKEIRHKYGLYQNVLLTDEEYQTLCKEFPYDFEQRIARLSEYMGSTGKSYKNHLITIRSWARREKSRKTQEYSHEAYQFQEGDSL